MRRVSACGKRVRLVGLGCSLQMNHLVRRRQARVVGRLRSGMMSQAPKSFGISISGEAYRTLAISFNDFSSSPGWPYSCLQWSCPSAGCTARVVHQKIRKLQKCGRISVVEYLSQHDTECRKCALRRTSSPEEAKHGTRSDFMTGYIGAYYRSERPPGNCLLEHRKHIRAASEMSLSTSQSPGELLARLRSQIRGQTSL